MKVIKILGTGCPKCQLVTKLVENVVEEKQVVATIVKVQDILEIMQYEVMSTPAIVVDGVVRIKGRVPSKEEIATILQ